MKYCINGIIVVEGKTDVDFVSQFIDAEFVTTNGSEIPNDTIEYLKNAAKTRDVYILTDPDSPGKRIRDILDQNINGLKHCFVKKENSIKKNKVGVAESTKEEILHALNNAISIKKDTRIAISNNDLMKLGLIGEKNSADLRRKICEKFSLGYCNGKTLYKRINNSGITIQQIKEFL